MIRLGRNHSNLMVDVKPQNAKLRGRVVGILEEATGAPEEERARALDASDGDTKTGIVSLLAGVDAGAARAALEANDRRVRAALPALDISLDHSATTTDEVPMEE